MENPPLTAAEAGAVLRDIAAARGLPARAYTSSEWTRVERDTLLGRTWTAIGFADEAPPGHAAPVDFLGLPLLLVRDRAGTARVFHNVCRHRGHRLVAEAGAVTGVLRCPYHSWTYALDGTLRGTPHLGGPGVHDVPGFDRAGRGLVEVPSAVWLGMVFVNLSGDAPPLAEHVAPLLERWAPYVGPRGLEAQVRAPADGARLDLEVAANWKLAVENYCESYHLPWVHPGLNAYSRLEDHYNIVAGDWGAGQGSLAFEFTERAGISLPRFPDWPAGKAKVAEYVALFPNVLLGLQIDHCFAIVLKPLAHDRTLESLRIYYVGEEGAGGQLAPARRVMLEGWREVFAEDVRPVEEMQRGRASPAFDGGAFSPVLDVPTHAFHRWVAQRLAPA